MIAKLCRYIPLPPFEPYLLYTSLAMDSCCHCESAIGQKACTSSIIELASGHFQQCTYICMTTGGV